METRFHTQLRVKIEEAIRVLVESIAAGVCTDYGHYRNVVGHINGLKAALEIANDVEKEYE